MVSAREAAPGDAVLVGSAQATPTIAVILTGNLTDGTEGIRAVKLGGGRAEPTCSLFRCLRGPA
jgi:two-component system, chemotaxis family, protein-glutamate methylesterase/glutaminase